jgi:hypothetical protein
MRIPSKTATFWILMAASAVSAFVLPRAWTAPGRGLFQPLALLQWPASWFAHRAEVSLGGAGAETLSGDQTREVLDENEQLKRQVIQQRLALQEAERRIEELSGFAGQMPDGYAGIIIAPVVAYDANPRHATVLIAKGSQKQWVREGEWVVALSGGAPEWDADATVRDLLHRGWLVGRVSEVHPRVARVQLATDPRFQCGVRAGRVLADGTVQLASEACVLNGIGAGRMRITQAVQDYCKTGYQLAVVPSGPELPTALTLGRIETAAPRDDSPQHFDLGVVPWGRVDRLAYVYVIWTEP